MTAKPSKRGARRGSLRDGRRAPLLLGAAALVALVAGLAFSGRMSFGPDRGPTPTEADVPAFDEANMEPRVAAYIQSARGRVLADLGSGPAWGQLGLAFDAHEIHDSALACYRIAQRLDPKEFRWAYYLGRVLEFKGDDPSEMVKFYEMAVRIRPDYAPLQVRLGDALHRQDRFDDARVAFERALALDPSSWKAHRGIGQAYLALQKAPEAVSALERAAALNPDDGAAHASLARALLLTGDRTRATLEAARSRELEPIHVAPDPVAAEIGAAGISGGTCFRRAEELMKLGRYPEAIQNLVISEEVMPENPHVQVRWGRCLQQLRRHGDAIDRYSRALQLRDDLDDVHLQAGLLLTAEGRPKDAIPHLRKALRTLDDAATRAALGAALGQSGDLPGAAQEFEEAARRGTLEASALNNWGSVLARLGDPKGAVTRFAEAAHKDPGSASALFNWGRALEDSGDLAGALGQYEAAARIDPRGPAAGRLRELTANSQK